MKTALAILCFCLSNIAYSNSNCNHLNDRNTIPLTELESNLQEFISSSASVVLVQFNEFQFSTPHINSQTSEHKRFCTVLGIGQIISGYNSPIPKGTIALCEIPIQFSQSNSMEEAAQKTETLHFFNITPFKRGFVKLFPEENIVYLYGTDYSVIPASTLISLKNKGVELPSGWNNMEIYIRDLYKTKAHKTNEKIERLYSYNK